MAHGDFVRPGGQWPVELVPGAQDAQRLDERQRRSVNGDLGGTWNPDKPVVIGGAGVQLGTASYFYGGVTTKTGGRLIAPDPPTIIDTRGQTLVVPALELGVRILASGGTLRYDDYIAKVGQRWGISFSRYTPSVLGLTIPRRYLHQGARLVSVVLDFVMGSRPAALPTTGLTIFPIEHAYDGTAHPCTPPTLGAPLWASGVAHVLNDYILPSGQATNAGSHFKATSIAGAGHTGASEPNWASAPLAGNSVNDYATYPTNGVVWTNTGRNGWLSTLGDTVDSYYANGAPQQLAYDTDPASSAGMNTIANATNGATLIVTNIDPVMIFTGMQLTYYVSSMAFE